MIEDAAAGEQAPSGPHDGEVAPGPQTPGADATSAAEEATPPAPGPDGARFMDMAPTEGPQEGEAEAAPAGPDAAPEPLPEDDGQRTDTHLGTDCPALDELLDGGLESDAITLVFGEGGSGKTNLALQCARVATAAGKRVAYVDTEGVSARRLEQVFAARPRADAERILFFTPYTIAEQEKMVAKTALLRDVGLIVIDSINMHYRLHIDDKDSEREASASLFKQLHHLTGHARRHGIPVLVTGQVYGGEDATQPFARRVMEHLVKALVRFEKRPDGARRATVLKHRSIEEGRQALFRIGADGLQAA